MPHVRDYFSASYADARDRFRKAAMAAGLSVTTHVNPKARGPKGEELTTDVVRVGPTPAQNVILVTSGTHGVEGFCGSGSQIGLLAEGLHRELAPDTALVLVHAINPYGFAHERRVNEDNVDLNRNFRDYGKPAPENLPYRDVHAMLVPADWDGPAREKADAAIMRYVEDHGQFAFQAAVSTGQWEYDDGLFFGGKAATWSNQTWRKLIREHAKGAKRVVHLDFHTGLGAYGDCELIFGLAEPVKDILARSRAWYGKVTCPAEGDSLSANVQGVIPSAVVEEAPGAEVTPVALEYGVKPVMDTLGAVRADNWLYRHGKLDSPLGHKIKADIRSAFYGETDDWKQKVFDKAVEVYRQSIAGLRAS